MLRRKCESDRTSWMSDDRQPSGREACIAGRWESRNVLRRCDALSIRCTVFQSTATGNSAMRSARRGLPERYPDFLTLRSIPIGRRADCRLVVMHSAQRDGVYTTGHTTDPNALGSCAFFRGAGFRLATEQGSLPTGSSSIGDGDFSSPAPETSLHVYPNLQS
ncbi:sul1_32_EF592571 [Klebsiella pneumoniae]|nr:sul1_32_EF592571 [Klebsiella pneumoniae]